MLFIQWVTVEAMPKDLPVLVASPIRLSMLLNMGQNSEGTQRHGQPHAYSFNVALF